MKHCNQLLVKNRWVAQLFYSITCGLTAKFIAILVFTVIFFLNYFFTSNFEKNTFSTFTIPENDFEWNYSTYEITKTLFFVPIIENLLIPFLFWVFHKFKFQNLLPIFFITLVSYLAHGAYIVGITGGVMFVIFAVYYSILRKTTGWFEAYVFTVIAHSTANLLSLGFSFL